jgi:hypothetical protein
MFECNEPHCLTRGIEIRNNGGNRLNCFLCDFDMCGECGKIEMKFNNVTKEKMVRKLSERSRASSRKQTQTSMAAAAKAITWASADAASEGKRHIQYHRTSSRRRRDPTGATSSSSAVAATGLPVAAVAAAAREQKEWELDPSELEKKLLKSRKEKNDEMDDADKIQSAALLRVES